LTIPTFVTLTLPIPGTTITRAAKVVKSFSDRLIFPSENNNKEGFKSIHSALESLVSYLRGGSNPDNTWRDHLTALLEEEKRKGDSRAGDELAFFKFPRTRHVAVLGPGVSRDDLIMDPQEARELFFNGRHVITVEEVSMYESHQVYI